MYAGEIDAAATELKALQHEEWEDTALAALTFVLALAATELSPTLALPLAIGALAPPSSRSARPGGTGS